MNRWDDMIPEQRMAVLGAGVLLLLVLAWALWSFTARGVLAIDVLEEAQVAVDPGEMRFVCAGGGAKCQRRLLPGEYRVCVTRAADGRVFCTAARVRRGGSAVAIRPDFGARVMVENASESQETTAGGGQTSVQVGQKSFVLDERGVVKEGSGSVLFALTEDEAQGAQLERNGGSLLLRVGGEVFRLSPASGQSVRVARGATDLRGFARGALVSTARGELLFMAALGGGTPQTVSAAAGIESAQKAAICGNQLFFQRGNRILALGLPLASGGGAQQPQPMMDLGNQAVHRVSCRGGGPLVELKNGERAWLSA